MFCTDLVPEICPSHFRCSVYSTHQLAQRDVLNSIPRAMSTTECKVAKREYKVAALLLVQQGGFKGTVWYHAFDVYYSSTVPILLCMRGYLWHPSHSPLMCFLPLPAHERPAELFPLLPPHPRPMNSPLNCFLPQCRGTCFCLDMRLL